MQLKSHEHEKVSLLFRTEQSRHLFPLYEIAPYSSGIPQFRIPYTLLREYLKPSYQNILIDNK